MIPWQIDATTHVSVLTTQVQDALSQAVPKSVKKVKPPWISHKSWDLKLDIAQFVRKRKESLRVLCKAYSGFVFYIWRANAFARQRIDDLIDNFELDISVCKFVFRGIAWRDFNIRRWRIELRQSIADDKTTQLSGMAAHLTDAVDKKADDTWRALRALNPKTRKKFGPAAVQALDDGQGHIATTFEECRQMWHDHFSKIEAAYDVDFSQLLIELRDSHLELRQCIDLDQCVMPSRAEIEASFCKARNNRSCGPDGLPDELFSLFPREMGRAFGPVFFKAILRLDMPLQWVGGLMHELFKGNGAANLMQNWRSILCSNSGGKRLHAIVRPRLFHFADGWLSDSQCGGRPGSGIDFSSHIVKSFIDLLFHRRLSGTLTFVDIKSAFYSAMRVLFFATGGSEEDIAKFIASIGIDLDLINPFLEVVRKASVMAQMGASPHLEAVVGNLFRNSWWQMRGCPRIAKPQKGFSPGTGVADLAFSLIFRLYISAVQSKLIAAGLATSFKVSVDPLFSALVPDAAQDCIDTTWVDDTVVMSIASCAADVPSLASATCSIIFTELRRIAFDPNTKPGKCQVMPILNGVASVQTGLDIFEHSDAKCTGVDGWGRPFTVCYGLTYKHLGSYKDARRCRSTEVTYRCGEAASASRELFAALRKTAVPPCHQWRFAASLCVSRLTLDAHTDAYHTAGSASKVRATYDGCARRCCAIKFFDDDSKLPADVAIAKCGAVPYDFFLAFTRLAYYGRLLSRGPLCLFAALDLLASARNSYVSVMKKDLKLVLGLRGAVYDMPDPYASPAECFDFIGADPKRWKKISVRSKLAFTSHWCLTTLGNYWESQVRILADSLLIPLIPDGVAAVVVDAPRPVVFECWCSFTSKIFAGLVNHAAAKHGYKRKAYDYVNEEGHCFGCLRTFHSKRRLLDHFTRGAEGRDCLNRVIAHYPACYVPDAKARYGKGHNGNAIYRRGPPRDKDRLPIVRRSGPRIPLEHPAAPGIADGLFYNVIEEAPPPVAAPPGSALNMMLQHSLERLICTVNFFVLNLCCGHRRAGDIADMCARLVFPAAMHIWIISVDIVSGNPEHNLASESRFSVLLGHIRAGRVHAWIIGPPCETWSRARFRQILDMLRRAPRPLRAPETPWCLENLGQREYQQLTIGNILLQCSVQLILESIPVRCSGVLEHPDCPQEPHIPSIWKLEILRRLRAHASSDQFSFLQGPLGQVAPKPTRFHAVHLPEIRPIIHKLSNFSRRYASSGDQFDADGSFSTAKLKSYPPLLNGSFVLSLAQRFSSIVAISADERREFLESAERIIVGRASFIDHAPEHHDDLSFVEQPLDIIDKDHALHSFAAWPDRHAARGKDFAF